MTRARWYDLTQ